MLHEWSEDVESLTREQFKEREKEANEFAAAFLLQKRPLDVMYQYILIT